MFLKKIILVIFTGIAFTAMAQTNNEYLKNWKKVEDLEKKGLTKSALAEVINIYNLAVKDNNDAQQIKSCMYQVKYHNLTDENSQENNIFFVDTLIDKAKAPAKNILQSMQAEMCWQYLQNNRWKFYNRTALQEEKSKEISTWSIDKLHRVIAKLYKASLQNESLLKATSLTGFEAIIIKGENTRQLRPTLYDFIAHRALSYFMTDENQLTKPAYQFKISDSKAFAPVAEFVSISFKTKDTGSLHHTALLLLQNILKFHTADSNPEALIDADLIRLNFVHTNATMESKEKLYEEALKDVETRFASNPAVAQAAYLRAKIYYDRGQQYQANSKTENQYELKRAKELCETIFKKFPKSEGGINCQNLVHTILQPALNIETEKVNTINDPFRTLVSYKNVPKVYFRIIKTSKEEIKKFDRRDYEKLWASYVALKPLKSWSVTLPDLTDFQEHAAEIKIDGLSSGIYFILASVDENFALTKNIIAKQVIYVSNISYIHNNNNEYYVLHRDNGQPLPNTQVQVWETKYNYQNGNDDEIKAEKYTTDKNGMFKMKDSKDYRNVLLQLKNGTDELFMDDNEGYNTYNSYETPEAKPVTFLFTDRSIYRPGQTLYFKGIVIKNQKDAGKSAVVPGYSTKIILRNANYQKVTSLDVTSNEFGSFSGTFKLPEGALNGQFNIFDSTNNATEAFNVEEYKRPKFFTEIQKPKGTYRLNDSIKITGSAKAYAGNNIDGAKVKYRVVRKVRYPVWWEWGYVSRGRGKSIYGRNEETEITNGEVVTDAKGAFKITFKALPDESVDKKSQPVFNYEVSADVTDINGETRSGSTSVAVAYQMLQLNIDMPEKISADSLKKLNISSTNLNDIFEKANVTVTINKVKSPDKIYRERYWDMPDQFVMSKDEYATYFPYDIYKDEDKKSSWPLGDKVVDKTDTTREQGNWELGIRNWDAGWYKIIAITKDKYGEEVRAEKYIQLINELTKKSISEAIAFNVKKEILEPGEKVEYGIATGFDKIWLIHSLSKMDKTNITTYPTITKNQSAQFAEPAGEKDRGGMAMSYAFVQHNRVYKGGENFTIPWSNKELNISYTTFRDKLLPGANEKWSVKISGSKGEAVASEILAGMYDASLDQFKLHSWNRINIWPSLYNSVSWNEKGFTKVESEEYNKRDVTYIDPINKTYDRLGTYRTNKEVDLLYAFGAEDDKESRSTKYYMNFDMRAGNALGAESYRAQAVMAAPAADLSGAVNFLDGYVTSTSKRKEGGRVVNKIQTEFKAKNQLPENENTGSDAIQIRKNFKETAFFFPQLKTDAEGNTSFEFTIPEALTQWKLMTLAHTKDLASGYIEKTTVTQKPLMVQPNAPRFLREGDKMEFSAKIKPGR